MAAIRAGRRPIRPPARVTAAMTRMRGPILAGMIIAVTIAASGCGSANPQASAPQSSATPPAPTPSAAASGVPAGPPPAGYKWVGSAAQDVWLAVPRGWVVINPTKQSLDDAISRLERRGVSSAYLKTLLAQAVQRHYAAMALDLASRAQSPHHFATNVNAFCSPAGPLPNASSASALKASLQAGLAQLHGRVLAARKVTIHGDPGVRAEFTIPLVTGLTESETSYSVWTKNGRTCYITLSTDNPVAFARTFNKIGGTIRVP